MKAGFELVTANSPKLLNPMARVMEDFGSVDNTNPFLKLDMTINGIKGALFSCQVSLNVNSFRNLFCDGVNGGSSALMINFLSNVSLFLFSVPSSRTESNILLNR